MVTTLRSLPSRAPRRAAMAMALAALALPGCSCLERDWDDFAASMAEAAEDDGRSSCPQTGFIAWSREFLELAQGADPALLAQARRDAERNCGR